jgi:hypothetical protein
MDLVYLPDTVQQSRVGKVRIVYVRGFPVSAPVLSPARTQAITMSVVGRLGLEPRTNALKGR